MGDLLIGQLAEATDVPVATIRYYERRRLLPTPPRSTGGYRLYPTNAVRHVRFIRRAKRLGFSLREVSDLLELRSTTGNVCYRTQMRAAATITRIDSRIEELVGMRDELTELLESCQTRADDGECPIIDSLDETSPAQR